jgi:hypothetical protein
MGANGLWVEKCANFKFINGEMTECGRGRTGNSPSVTIVQWGSGGINLSDVRNYEIANNTFVQEYGGVFVKGLKLVTYSRANYNNGTLTYLHNGKYHDNVGTQDPVGSWTSPSGGYSRAISFEMHEVESDSIEWYNNTLDSNISIVMPQVSEGYSQDPFQNATFKTIPRHRFYNNTIDVTTRADADPNQFCIELSTHDVVVGPGNHFKGFTRCIQEFLDAGEAAPNPGHRRQNIRIFGNVFEDFKGSSIGIALVQNFAGWRDVYIYNNTANLGTTPSGGIMSFYNGGNPGSNTFGVPNWGTHNNVNFNNNIMVDPSGSAGTVQGMRATTGATFLNSNNSYNILRNCNFNQGITGTNNIDDDPDFVGSGAKPAPWFELQTTSPAKDAGINVGLPYNGAAPDMGAFEF